MKGQLVFEFILASIILFSIIIYTIDFMSSNMRLYNAEFLKNFLENKALQVSEILMNDPVNGFVTEWPLLSLGKMRDFNETCYDVDNYIELLNNFSLVEQEPYSTYYQLSIVVNGSGTKYVDCGRQPPQKITRATVTRFGLLPSNDIATVQIMIW